MVLLYLDADFVLICDGDRRKVDHPKRKRLKHLAPTPHAAPEILSLYAMNRLKDADVRKALAPFRTGKAAPAGPDGSSSRNKAQDTDPNR